MDYAPNYRRLLSPLKIGPITVKNRTLRTAHGTMMGDGGISDMLIAYHLERARGGIGLSVLEGAFVHPSSELHMPNVVRVWNDDIIPSYKKLMSAIEPSGMKMFQQLWHGGNIYSDWRNVTFSPSALPSAYSGIPSQEMTPAFMKELIQGFADAAYRCLEGGLHGVEVAGSHGYLITQFLSPWSNLRKDQYGGENIESRTLFLREVLHAMRDRVGRHMAVGLRIGAEDVEGGVSRADMVAAIDLCMREGLLDFVNLSVGGYHNPESTIPALHAPTGVELKWNGGVREETGAITFVTGRYRSLDEAEQLLASGEADMVGLTRATIADPHLVRKTLEEGPDSVRPCIGCNQLCVANVFMGMPMQCTVNPVVGIEAQFPEASLSRAEKPKKVLVVGGGPAGMEVARVAAIRGHDVQLHEAMADLGGAVRLTRPIPHLSGLADIIFWQERELYERQVSVSLSSFIEADDVISKQPDVVIIATGSMPREDGWQLGAPWVRLDNLEEPFQLVASDLLEGRVRIEPGATVIIVDDRGHAEAAGVAEFLLSKGAIVEFVTRFGDFAPNIGLAWRQRPTLRRLNRTERFECHTHAYIDRVEKNGVVQIGSIVGAKTKQIRSDHILFVGFNHPLIGLKQELEAAGFAGRVELVGDSKSPRYLHAAIHEAFQTALTI